MRKSIVTDLFEFHHMKDEHIVVHGPDPNS
jgi:hypothetical protein